MLHSCFEISPAQLRLTTRILDPLSSTTQSLVTDILLPWQQSSRAREGPKLKTSSGYLTFCRFKMADFSGSKDLPYFAQSSLEMVRLSRSWSYWKRMLIRPIQLASLRAARCILSGRPQYCKTGSAMRSLHLFDTGQPCSILNSSKIGVFQLQSFSELLP